MASDTQIYDSIAHAFVLTCTECGRATQADEWKPDDERIPIGPGDTPPPADHVRIRMRIACPHCGDLVNQSITDYPYPQRT